MDLDDKIGKYCAFQTETAWNSTVNLFCNQYPYGIPVPEGGSYDLKMDNMPDGADGQQIFWGTFRGLISAFSCGSQYRCHIYVSFLSYSANMIDRYRKLASGQRRGLVHHRRYVCQWHGYDLQQLRRLRRLDQYLMGNCKSIIYPRISIRSDMCQVFGECIREWWLVVLKVLERLSIAITGIRDGHKPGKPRATAYTVITDVYLFQVSLVWFVWLLCLDLYSRSQCQSLPVVHSQKQNLGNGKGGRSLIVFMLTPRDLCNITGHFVQ